MKKYLAPFLTFLVCAATAFAQETRHLTLAQAEQIALAEHPRISVANLTALASREVTSQFRSAFFPSIYANGTAVGDTDPNNTRLAAGGLNNPIVYDRVAAGVNISQLITDFGRAWDLTKSAKLRARAEQMNLEATREQVLLEVNNAYFSALGAQAVLQVALETVRTRKLIQQQTTTLATNRLKSELDVSFANVDYQQAAILLAKATNDLKASFAVLAAVLADQKPESFILDEAPMPGPVTNNVVDLTLRAVEQRPDLANLRFQRDAANEFARAEGKLGYPTISAIGAAGVIPAGSSHFNSDYAAAGVNLSLPIFTGGLFTARQHEAEYRARAADENLREIADNIIRDVQVTKLNLDYSYDRLALTRQLLESSSEALELARARFKNGLSSIIELSQAELNYTSAAIAAGDARYQYQIQHAALDFQLGHLTPLQP